MRRLGVAALGLAPVVSLVGLVGSPAAAAPADGPPDAAATSAADAVTVEANLLSAYVWRGNLFADSRLSPTLQATASWVRTLHAGANELSLSAFTSVSFRADHPFEIEPTVSYAWVGDYLISTIGYTAYLEPASDPPDVLHELALSIRRNAAVAPFLLLAIDPVRAKGWYVSGGVSAEASRRGWTGLARLGVGASTYQDEPTSIQDLTLEATATHPLRPGGYAGVGATVAVAGRTGEVYPVILLVAGFER
ncbi:MAG: hypothetical protein KBG28_09165 [Kofleriaceae bacterium]|nr:hypothetical protein [Kofleriaceae bacterium]MBP6837615.1 hypothetical protein [Kofleriaceae bacterium]MBP9204119.1 hypothetical protein [Kofleriaceae bacterium]